MSKIWGTPKGLFFEINRLWKRHEKTSLQISLVIQSVTTNLPSRETFSLPRSIEPSQLMVPQGEVTVSPFHIGAGTLAYLGQLFGLLRELALLHLTQGSQHPAGFKQRRA